MHGDKGTAEARNAAMAGVLLPLYRQWVADGRPRRAEKATGEQRKHK